MAVDKFEICQVSLDLLGVGEIDIKQGTGTNTSFTNSVSGEICSRHYDRTRQQLLRMHQWGFATTTRKLLREIQFQMVLGKEREQFGYGENYGVISPSSTINYFYRNGAVAPLFYMSLAGGSNNVSKNIGNQINLVVDGQILPMSWAGFQYRNESARGFSRWDVGQTVSFYIEGLNISAKHPLYRYAFNFPPHCLRIINLHTEIGESSPRISYAVETVEGQKFLFTNYTGYDLGSGVDIIPYAKTTQSDEDNSQNSEPPEIDLYVKCVEDIEDTIKFDSLFDNCLALLLASKMALPLGKGADVGRMFLQQFISMMPVATGADAQEGYQPDDLEADWISARS